MTMLVRIVKRVAVLAWTSPYAENENMNASIVTTSRICLLFNMMLSFMAISQAVSNPYATTMILRDSIGLTKEATGADDGLTRYLVRNTAGLTAIFAMVCYRGAMAKLEDIVQTVSYAAMYHFFALLCFIAHMCTETLDDSFSPYSHLALLLLAFAVHVGVWWKANVHAKTNPTPLPGAAASVADKEPTKKKK